MRTIIALIACVCIGLITGSASACEGQAAVRVSACQSNVRVSGCETRANVARVRNVVVEERVIRQIVDPVVIISNEEVGFVRRFPDQTITKEFRGPLGGGVKRSAGPNQRSLEINGAFGVPLIRRTTIVN